MACLRVVFGLVASLIASSSIFALGCHGGGPAGPLRLIRVESPLISLDRPLELSGEELPTGLRVQVSLRGTLHSAGRDARALDVSFVGRVLSPERINVALGPAQLVGWGQGTFDGQVEVSGAPTGAPPVRGRLAGVSIDVDALDARGAQQQRHAVARMLPGLGLGISDADSLEAGLLVSEVRPWSRAQRAGLRVGDVIVRSNGVRLHGLSAMAPGPSAGELVLRVQRPSGAQDAVHLSLASVAPLSDWSAFAWCVVGCVGLWFALGHMWPRFAPGRAMVWLLARAHSAAPEPRWLLGYGLGLSALVAALGTLFDQSFDPFGWLVVHLGCLLALRSYRALGGWPFVFDVCGLWAAVACVAAVSGTCTWAAIIHDQAGAPWFWNVAARPPLALACFVAWVFAMRLHVEAAAVAETWVDLLVERTARAVLSVLLSALFFGGSGVSSAAEGGALVYGVLAAAGKSSFCYWLLYVSARQRVLLHGAWYAVLGLAIAVWSWVAPGRTAETWIGSGMCVLAASALVTALMQAHREVLQALRRLVARPVLAKKGKAAKSARGRQRGASAGPKAASSNASRSASSALGLTKRKPARTPDSLRSPTQTTSLSKVRGSESTEAMPSSVKSSVS